MSRFVCGKPIGVARICTLHPDHEIPCEGNPPLATVTMQHSREDQTLCFQFGLILAKYDFTKYFRSKTHVDEVVEMHIARLGLCLSDQQIEMLKEIAFKYFNS
jgi:hypothetical protein